VISLALKRLTLGTGKLFRRPFLEVFLSPYCKNGHDLMIKTAKAISPSSV
jgi:hypothetical protein